MLSQIVSAIITKYIVFSGPTEPTWVKWYIREVGTAMLVGNLTLCFPLLLALYDTFKDKVVSKFGSGESKYDDKCCSSESVGKGVLLDNVDTRLQPSSIYTTSELGALANRPVVSVST